MRTIHEIIVNLGNGKKLPYSVEPKTTFSQLRDLLINDGFINDDELFEVRDSDTLIPRSQEKTQTIASVNIENPLKLFIVKNKQRRTINKDHDEELDKALGYPSSNSNSNQSTKGNLDSVDELPDDNKPWTGRFRKEWENGDVYEGEWIDGKMAGKGKKIWGEGPEKGDMYDGDWFSGKMTGRGRYVWVFGDRYKGGWKDGIRTGKGKYTWANGDIYEGDFLNNKIAGKGIYVWRDGKCKGDIYEGDWKDDIRTGKGKYTWANGDIYEGDFLNNKITGKGVKRQANGKVLKGVWKNDNLVRTDSIIRNICLWLTECFC